MSHGRVNMPDRRQALLPAVYNLPLPLPLPTVSSALFGSHTLPRPALRRLKFSSIQECLEVSLGWQSQ